MYTVYCAMFSNGKSYFGITKNLEERMRSHKKQPKRTRPVGHAIAKHGDPQWVVVTQGLNLEQAYAYECALIREFQTNDRRFGYNLTSGGDGVRDYEVTPAARKKMSDMRKGVKWKPGRREAHTDLWASMGSPIDAIAVDRSHGFFCYSIGEAARITGATRANIRHVRKGVVRYAKGYTFA